MDRKETSAGMEVNHPKYGRGCITDLLAAQDEGVEEVTVFFYLQDEMKDVPVYPLRPAAEVTSIESKVESTGLAIRIDDGFYQLHIEPDGEGTGYAVALRAGEALVDRAQLSSEGFI